MITFKHKGDFKSTTNFLTRSSKGLRSINFDSYGREGVAALSKNTPVSTGETADSWSYEITRAKGKTTINWINSNRENGVLVAIILQYGHGTKNGGWVDGRDYINPSIRPIFDKIADLAWKEVNTI